MGKFLITWETNQKRMPADPKELGVTVTKMVEMVKQSMKEGTLKDWGVFVGGAKGYAIGEGKALDIYQELQKYYPYISFNVQEVLSTDDVLNTIKSMMG